MHSTNHRRHRLATGNARARRLLTFAAAAATGAFAFAGHASAQQVYFDTNGTTSGLGSGTGTWNAALADWSTGTAGTAVGSWTSGSIANFNAGYTVHFAGLNAGQTIGGINFNSGATTIDLATGAVNPYLDFGTAAFSITAASAVATRSIIAAPIKGSGDMTVNIPNAVPLELAGDMSQFTGNIFVKNTSAGAGTLVDFQVNNNLGTSASTIYVDQNARLNSNNPGTFNGVNTPRSYTIGSKVVLNYNAINNATSAISASNGDNATGSIGQSSFVPGTQEIVTFGGVISSPGTVNTNVVIGIGASGGRGTVVLAAQNTWIGNTQVTLASNNGLLQMGVDNALPTSTVLTFGSAANSVAPMDLNGHSITLGGLATGTTYNSNDGGGGTLNGNVYNTSINGSAPAPATITIAGAANTTYAGDIGCTNIDINPFNNNAPYVTGTGSSAHQVVQASKNISLVINGPGSLTLAPASNHQNGDEYTGTTVVNGGTLRFGRVLSRPTGGAPSPDYTITGGGSVVVNSGATLASVATGASAFAGGASGSITLNTGSTLNIGDTAGLGVLSTSSMTVHAGSHLNFDFGGDQSDALFVTGGFTLDPAGTSNVKLGLASGATFVSPGTYAIITAGGGISAGAGLTLDATALPSGETAALQLAGNQYQVVITAPIIQWDPNGDGPSHLLGSPSQKPSEGPGTWTDGVSTFVNYGTSPVSEYVWSNAQARDVVIGNDSVNGAGDVITLGSNIVTGKITFGPIFPGLDGQYPGYNYTIAGSGSFTLKINGGIDVSNAAATYNSDGSLMNPSAEIDAPIVLGADQSWNVPVGEFLDIKGTVTGGHVLTKVGAGTVFLETGGGSVSSLAVNGGTVLLGAANAVGASTPISLSGGALKATTTMTLANPISVGTGGGSIGATSGTLTVSQNITGGNDLSVVDAGNDKFNGTLTVKNLTVSASGGNTFVGAVSSTSVTVSSPATTTFSGAVSATGNVTVTGAGATTFAGNVTAATFASTLTAGTGTATLSGSNTLAAVSITGGTVTAASAGALGAATTPITLAAPSGSNTGGQLVLASNPTQITLPNPINIGTNGSAAMGISATVPVTLSGVLSGSGNISLNGPDYTLSGTNTNANSIVLPTEGMTLHVTNASGLGTATLAFAANATLDTPVNVSTGAGGTIRGSATDGGSYTLTKTGTGTLTLSGSGSVNNVPGSALLIKQGNVQMNSIAALGTTNVTSNPGLAITANAGTSLILNWATAATRYSTNITLNGGSLVRANNTVSGDYQLSVFNTDDATLLFGPAPTFTVAADSTISNLETGLADSASVSRDILIEMPVVVNSGATLTSQTVGGTTNLGHAAIVFRGVANDTTYKYQNITLQAGATLKTAGAGETDIGGSGRGIPIIANGTPGNDSKLLITGSNHTFLRDAGSATQGAATTDMTRLVINGTGTAGLRVEAPMNAVYVNSGSNNDQCTTGLFGVNTVGAPNGNGFTILSANRAAALSNTYTLSDGTTVITPKGTLTLAATDAAGATGVVDAGPGAASALTLALDNTSTSGNLVYQLDGQATTGSKLTNFAGITIQRTNASAGSVKGQLKSNTRINALTLLNSTTFDLAKRALVVETSAPIAGYLSSHALFSSAVDTDPNATSTIAQVRGSDLGLTGSNTMTFLGLTLDANSLLLDPTYYGDINLDGKINADDYALMDRSVAKHLTPNWIDGDFNADNLVNSTDYFLIDRSYGLTHGNSFSPDFLAQRASQFGDTYVSQLVASVPEPTTLSLLGLAAIPLLSRRRRTAH